MTEPKGRDVGWAFGDGDVRPISEVLDERKRKAGKIKRAEREAAFRERAWLQAMLGSCLCLYPLVKAATASEHDEWCPSHGLYLSSEIVKARAAAETEGAP